jgi:PilZ domain-containing protein
MGERRRSTRQKSFLRGCIYFNNRRSAIDCLVRDVSAAGARLIFSDAVSVPDVVDLYIPQKEQTLRAHVQWRHGEEAGVAFAKGLQAPAPAPALDRELADRVEKLESEITSLRRMLKRLKTELAARTDEEAA